MPRGTPQELVHRVRGERADRAVARADRGELELDQVRGGAFVPGVPRALEPHRFRPVRQVVRVLGSAGQAGNGIIGQVIDASGVTGLAAGPGDAPGVDLVVDVAHPGAVDQPLAVVQGVQPELDPPVLVAGTVGGDRRAGQLAVDLLPVYHHHRNLHRYRL